MKIMNDIKKDFQEDPLLRVIALIAVIGVFCTAITIGPYIF